jgi:hypothetical protein
MKLPFKRFIPHTLAFMLIASSPLSVLSTTAHASSLEKANQEQQNLIDSTVQDQSQNPVVEETGATQEPVTNVQTDTTPSDTPATSPAESTPEPTPPTDVTPPTTPPVTAPPDSGTQTQQPTEEPSTFDSRFEEAKKAMSDAKSYDEQRQLVDDAMQAFRKEPTVEKLQLAVDYTVLLPYSTSNKSDKAEFADTLYVLFSFIDDGKDKDDLLYHFTDVSIKQTWITMNRNDLEIAKMVLNMLPEGAKKEQFKTEFDKLNKAVYAHNGNPDSGYVDWNNDPNIDYGEPPTQDNSDGDWKPGVDPDKWSEPTYPTPNPFEEGYSVFNYSIENGTCYKTSTEYDNNGNFKKRVKSVASADEKVFCVVEIPSPQAKDYYEKGWDKDMLANLNGSPDGSLNPNDSANAQATALKTNTIQYTFEKGSDSPYYYDTGIHVSKDNKLTYQQERDALYQIAVQAKGKFVEDKDRALALLDGQIILVEDKGKAIPFQDFISLFKDTSIGVKAQGTRSGDTYALVDLIEVKEVSTVMVNGKEVNLETSPIVDDGKALFPIDKVVKSLDGKVSSTDDSTTVEYKGNRITFTDNQLSAKENGKDKELSVPTRKNQDGVRLVDVNALLDFLHASIEVHAESNQVVIVTK